ncbi:hypothetical protein ACFQ0D_25930, partial [Micromonospora zhanjiangensis]
MGPYTVDSQLPTVLVTAAVSVATTLVATFYGPAWKDRLDARRGARQRSEQVLARYSEPLARAAFDLQSRLYNIRGQGFLTDERIPADYRRLSTLWLFGQFLAWLEIVRREVQVIDAGDVRRTTALQRHLFEVVDILATGGIGDPTFRVFRATQRAVGELMVVERGVDDRHRSDSLGYGEFVRRFETEPQFARFGDGLDRYVVRLVRGEPAGPRISLAQRALIDLIDFVDPDWVRFPDPDERGRIPLPDGLHYPKRQRAGSEFARFTSGDDPAPVLTGWARDRGLPVRGEPPGDGGAPLTG